MNQLNYFYQNHKGKLTDRWMSYINQYERLFSPLRSHSICLLEIGIQNGGSLDIWGKYFSHASHLVGCDINPQCLNLQYEDPRIKVLIGDASTKETELKIDKISNVWDIVIDDGSHLSRHIIDSFARFFPKISDGGLYIAEDLHCSYWQEFEGGLADPYSSMAFFKRLADLVNFEHWGTTLDRKTYLSAFQAYYGCSSIDESALEQVHSVEFVNSQCIVRKRALKENILGTRVVVGLHESVTSGLLQYNKTVITPLDQTGRPWSESRLFNVTDIDKYAVRFCASELRANDAYARAEANSLRIVELEHCINELKDNLTSMEKKKNAAHAEAEVNSEQITTLQKIISLRDNQITALMAAQSTSVAQLARIIARVANRLLPKDSFRRRISVRGLAIVKLFHRHGTLGALRVIRNTRYRKSKGRSSTRSTVCEATSIAEPPEFAAWINANEPTLEKLQYQREASQQYQPESPLFSVILPVYKIPGEILAAAISSVQQQTWLNWELCITYADQENEENWTMIKQLASCDPRLRIKRLTTNGGISRNSNAALEFARGEFIALLDHDDELTLWALHDMAVAIEQHPEIDFLYSDKDLINANGSLRLNPLFKPQWSPEMMYSVNYLTHFNVMRRTIINTIGGWNPDTDGAQDWDIFLRVAELSRRVEHVPAIHYHWRIIPGSTATGSDAKPYAPAGQLRALERKITRLGLNATVMPHPDSGFKLIFHRSLQPSVDLILYSEFDSDPMILINEAVLQLGVELASVTVLISCEKSKSLPTTLPGGIPLHVLQAQSNHSLSVAEAILIGTAPAVLLMDYCVSGLSPDSLQDLTGWVLKHPEIGFTTPLILLNNETVVEAGRVVGDGYQSQPLFQGMPLRQWGPIGGPLWYRNVSAGSARAIAFKRTECNLGLYASLPIDEAVVACCAEILTKGFRGLVSPHARIQVDEMLLSNNSNWNESMRHDPYFHPSIWLSSTFRF
ncbi:MAG: glycosyltransferase [Legionella sp.]|uniref:glycosyltransferase n=1 Tax=Legionella sp. TaxID=459 RepID=UPI0039E6ECCE